MVKKILIFSILRTTNLLKAVVSFKDYTTYGRKPTTIEHDCITTRNYTFNIARLTSVLDKTDVNTNAVAYL